VAREARERFRRDHPTEAALISDDIRGVGLASDAERVGELRASLATLLRTSTCWSVTSRLALIFQGINPGGPAPSSNRPIRPKLGLALRMELRTTLAKAGRRSPGQMPMPI